MSFKLPESPESRAYKGVVQVLRTDPTLRGYGLKIRAWEGGVNDAKEVESLGELPLLMITPGRASSRWLSPAQHESQMPIELSVCVETQRASDLLDLWHAVRTALFPVDAARLHVVRTLMDPLVAQGTLSSQATGVQTLLSDLKAMHATGVLSITLHVNT
jgi:hypothetical protein